MSRVGLNYGPKFTGLKNIAASVLEKVATADVVDRQEAAESFYMLHPSTLDLVFQSLTVAGCQGIYRTFKSLFLPTFVGKLYVGNMHGKTMQVNTATTGKPGTIQGNSYGFSENEVVFHLKDFRGKAMEDLSMAKHSDLKLLQVQWKPRFDYLDAGDLMKLKYDIRDQIQHLER